ncbi:MAG: PAS domain S-box protein [Spirochaetes bacterium]|nr:PAS domain S-box protein [Spirochaetota bacterium]
MAKKKRPPARKARAQPGKGAAGKRPQAGPAKRGAAAPDGSGELWDRAYHEGPVAMAVLNRDFRFLRANAAFCRLMGYPENRLQSLTFTHLTHPDHVEKDVAEVVRLAKGEIPCYRTEKRYLRSDGNPLWASVVISAVRDPGGAFLNYLAMVLDITEAKRRETEVAEREYRFRSVIEETREGILLTDEEGKLLAWNREMQRISGIGAPAALGRPLWEVQYEALAPDQKKTMSVGMLHMIYADILAKGASPILNRYIEDQILRPDGSSVAVEAILFPIRTERGFLISGIMQDVGGRRLIENALSESEHRYRTLVENSLEGIAILRQGAVVFANPAMLRILGLPDRSEITGRAFADWVTPEFLPALRERLEIAERRVLPPDHCEFRARRQDGALRECEVACSGLTLEGEYFVQLSVRDVTESRLSESRLRASLAEKEVLLRELYHRTKNNMQVISAMMNLHARASTDAAFIALCRDMEARIQSMALVHQKLYQGRSLSSIRIREYAQELCALLRTSYRAPEERIAVSCEVEDLLFPIDLAIPCGLVLSELLSNSFKHAFPGDRRGTIRVGLARSVQGLIEIRFRDDGAGFPDGFDPMRDGHMGLQGLSGIVGHQLGGRVRFEPGPGVSCVLQFPEKGAAGSAPP